MYRTRSITRLLLAIMKYGSGAAHEKSSHAVHGSWLMCSPLCVTYEFWLSHSTKIEEHMCVQHTWVSTLMWALLYYWSSVISYLYSFSKNHCHFLQKDHASCWQKETSFNALLQYHLHNNCSYHTRSRVNHKYAKSRCSAQSFIYYAGIMLDAFLYFLCSKLCRHNWHRPNAHTSFEILLRSLFILML